MTRATKTNLAVSACVAITLIVRTAQSEEALRRAAAEQEERLTSVRPIPHFVPHQPLLGIYGHLEPRWGMVIDHVFPGMPAFWAGLERGDVIVQMNRRPIRGYRDYYWALRTSGPVCWLLVDDVRGRGRIWVLCHLRRQPGPILFGSPRKSSSPARGDSHDPQLKPPDALIPPRQEASTLQKPEDKQQLRRPSTSPPDASPSNSPETVKGSLL
jgi:hypothetical protein